MRKLLLAAALFFAVPVVFAADEETGRRESMLAQDMVAVGVPDIWSVIPLDNVGVNGDMSALEEFIGNGVDVSRVDSWGRALLQLAIERGGARVVRALVEGGADINEINSLSGALLHEAHERRHAPVNVSGDLPVIDALVENGADADEVDSLREVLRQKASERMSNRVFSQLSDETSPSLVSRDFPFPYVIGERDGLSARGSAINEYNWDGRLLLRAIERGGAPAVEVAIEWGADVNKEDPFGNTPLHRAVEEGDLPAVNALIAAGADANKIHVFRGNPLNVAVERGDVAIVEALLVAGAKPVIERGSMLSWMTFNLGLPEFRRELGDQTVLVPALRTLRFVELFIGFPKMHYSDLVVALAYSVE